MNYCNIITRRLFIVARGCGVLPFFLCFGSFRRFARVAYTCGAVFDVRILVCACQVRWYCREAGVRALGQKLERVARKLALDVVKLQEGGPAARDTEGAKAG